SRELVLIDLIMAKPWKRLAAWLIDEFILSITVALPVYLLLKEPYPYTRTAQVFIIASLVYFSSLEGWPGQSIGKHMMNLIVCSEDGGRVGFKKALLRRVGLATIFGLFDAAAILATAKRQRLFDIIAGTVVVEAAHEREARAYLRGATTTEVLKRLGVSPMPTEEERLEQTMKRMKEMLVELRRQYRKGKLTRDEYSKLKEKYEERLKQLEQRLVGEERV
ncbi:MAG: RDD family protein, partial [Hadesarchaea archaeon]|nr:RDD family protein [Hadesarchaea archaeon]